ncbi:MAG: serine/threonine protein phosphatase [Natronosporangium sp.]
MAHWVLGRRCGSFPLLYHWRVLAGAPAVPPELADPRMVAYWGGSAAVRERLAALADASASLVLFLEHLPQNLSEWLAGEAAGGPDRVAAACSMVERELRTAVAFMNSNGLLHFDAHFRNVLTDGRRLYLADLGLASSPRFALADDERAFLRNHLTYDRCQTVTELVNWLVTALPGSVPPAAERDELIRRYADGADPGADVPPPAAAVIRRYAPIVATMNGFYLRLHLESRATPYPADQLRQLCATIAPDGWPGPIMTG